MRISVHSYRFVCWLLNVPATCECISGTDLLNFMCCHTEIEGLPQCNVLDSIRHGHCSMQIMLKILGGGGGGEGGMLLLPLPIYLWNIFQNVIFTKFIIPLHWNSWSDSAIGHGKLPIVPFEVKIGCLRTRQFWWLWLCLKRFFRLENIRPESDNFHPCCIKCIYILGPKQQCFRYSTVRLWCGWGGNAIPFSLPFLHGKLLPRSRNALKSFNSELPDIPWLST